MDAVLPNSPSDHDNEVSWIDPFDVTLLALDPSRDDSSRPTKDERLSDKSVIKYDTPIDRWNAALVAPVLDSLPDAVKNPAWVKESWGQGALIVRRGETKNIRIENQPGSFPRSKGISVNTNDPGQGPTIGVQG